MLTNAQLSPTTILLCFVLSSAGEQDASCLTTLTGLFECLIVTFMSHDNHRHACKHCSVAHELQARSDVAANEIAGGALTGDS